MNKIIKYIYITLKKEYTCTAFFHKNEIPTLTNRHILSQLVIKSFFNEYGNNYKLSNRLILKKLSYIKICIRLVIISSSTMTIHF